jgi:chromosome segregation ATPase
LLGTSVDSVRRRIKAGRIRATYDERGRVRIVATVSTPSVETDLTPLVHESSSVARLWEELKAVKSDLERSLADAQLLRRQLGEAHVQAQDAQQALERFHSETEDLQDELETTRQALEHTQGELSSLWRVMSSRTERQEHANRFGVTDGNEAFDLRPGLANLSTERERIQSQISRVRDLSRRRRWPWPQAS